MPAFAAIAPNPTVELPFPAAEVIADTDMVLLTHMHPDHFDEPAQEALPKFLPVFCAYVDQANIEDKGFTNVQAVTEPIEWEGITIEATPAQHGSGDWLSRMGHVTGFILSAPNRPKIYIASDTIWYPEVQAVIDEHKPNIIITNSGGAHFPNSPPIIMDIEQTLEVCKAAPKAKVIATHIGALDHCPVTREALREAADAADISDKRLLIPEDGEFVSL